MERVERKEIDREGREREEERGGEGRSKVSRKTKRENKRDGRMRENEREGE